MTPSTPVVQEADPGSDRRCAGARAGGGSDGDKWTVGKVKRLGPVGLVVAGDGPRGWGPGRWTVVQPQR